MEETIGGLLARLAESGKTLLRLIAESRRAEKEEKRLEAKVTKLERELIRASVENEKMREARDFCRGENSKQSVEIFNLKRAAKTPDPVTP